MSMAVFVHPDTGPSYILHDPTPGRGPAVCANCVHVRKGGYSERTAHHFCEAWTCGAAPVQIKRQAGTDPITGEHVPAWTIGTRCTAKNKTGECPDFRSHRNGGDDRRGNVGGGEETASAGPGPGPEAIVCFLLVLAVTIGGIGAAAGWWGGP